MKVGIKYCGGCNPRYDRKDFVERLKKEFDNIMFKIAAAEDYYEIILVICGCHSGCANYNELSYKNIIIIKAEDNYYRAKNFIDDYCHNRGEFR
ncbi:hypothetical protein ACPWSR_03810 [Alloiococcus sp. CFN-8]|uniref:hypothetical protein n=1 Tax=Alloiococcus sp. CFN-8 TaxID=3416081 RepID=UPI003CF6A1E9